MDKINLQDISYDETRANLVEFIKSKDQFSDWEFEGSNISFLVDMLTYVAYHTNVYQSFALNETFLDTATQRSNIVAKAKGMGYIPQSRRTARLPLNLRLDVDAINADGIFLPDSMTIPVGSTFSVKLLDKIYQFSTLNTYAIFNDAGVYEIENMVVWEGVRRVENTSYAIDQKIVLPFGVDTTTIRVDVANERWEYATSGIRYTSLSKIWYLQENNQGLYEIYFGDGNISANPGLNASIKVTYLESSGSGANAGVAPFEIAYTDQLIIDGINYTKYLKYEPIVPPYGGTEREDTESIRKNATYSNISQNRAVTVRDYIYVLETIFSNEIIRANAWDINDLQSTDALELGKVTVALQPRNYRVTPYLQQYTKDIILRTMSKNYILGGIRINLLDPLYLKVGHNITIYYDEQLLDREISAIKDSIIRNTQSLYDSSIVKFDTYLPVSRIQSMVDSSDRAIVSSVINIDIEAETELFKDQPLTYLGEINNEIKVGTLSSSDFGLYDEYTETVDGIQYGVIKSNFGDVGTINYTSGIISFNIEGSHIGYDGYLSVYFEPVDPFIKVQREALLIDSNRYTWNFIEVRTGQQLG